MHTNNANPSIIRKLNKGTKPTIWLKDYVTTWKPSGQSTYPISHYVSYAHLPEYYQAYLSAFSIFIEPKSFYEASKDERWVKAMQEEVYALEANNT